MLLCVAWSSSLIAVPFLSFVFLIVFSTLIVPSPLSVVTNVTTYSLLSTVMPEPSVLVSFTVYLYVWLPLLNVSLPKSIAPALLLAVVLNALSSTSVGLLLSAVALNVNVLVPGAPPFTVFVPVSVSSPLASYVLSKFTVTCGVVPATIMPLALSGSVPLV